MALFWRLCARALLIKNQTRATMNKKPNTTGITIEIIFDDGKFVLVMAKEDEPPLEPPPSPAVPSKYYNP